MESTIGVIESREGNESQSAARQPSHHPGGSRLLDLMMQKLNIRSDRALGRTLDLDSATISRIRNKRIPVSASVLIRMHELTDMPIKEMKRVLDASDPI